MKSIRRKWRMEQSDFGDVFGVSRGMVSQYENGYALPSIDLLVKLQRLSGVNIEYIATRELVPKEIPDSPLEISAPPLLEESDAQNKLLYIPDMLSYIQELGERVRKLEEEK